MQCHRFPICNWDLKHFFFTCLEVEADTVNKMQYEWTVIIINPCLNAFKLMLVDCEETILLFRRPESPRRW